MERKERKSFTGTENPMDILTTMAEGNPGAINVLLEIFKTEELIAGLSLVLKLDEMNMRGPQIWVGYKDHCGCDIDTFKQAVVYGDQAMVDKVNSECFHPDLVEEYGAVYGEKAVRGEIHGESNGRML